MKKITKTLMLVLLVSFIAKADFVDFNFAKQIAKNHYCGLVDKIPYDQVTLELSHTELRNGMAMYYVFDVGENNGFVIISADNNVYPVLGYSFEKNFNESLTNLPPNFSEWMDSYSDQIEYVIQNTLSGDQSIATKWTELAINAQNPKSTDDVDPLLDIYWDQGQYYNALCPVDAAGPDGHALVGCVATTMGQIMKYHNHPVQGTGSHSYYAFPYGTLSADFGATTYNWSSMPNNVYSYNTSVATLLYHCGVSVDMDYGPDASGAYSIDARNALVDYFSYSDEAALLCKSSYTNSTWETMLRNELDASQPLFYQGSGPDGGHAWTCDGYQGTSYFHFNWGWSGYANGYFYLNNLNPGGLTFNDYQCAIFNLYPDEVLTLDPPTNLTATIVADNDVLLEWDAPSGSGAGDWIHWDDQTNSGNGIGLTSGGTLFVASRWTPTDLTSYNGQTITQISFFANDDPSATYVIKAWTGSNAGTQIVSQSVSSFNVNQFNIIDLTTPIVINASDELWFGYAVTHGGSTYPAGCDDGPAIANKGDMISVDGSSWESMSTEYGLDYNWNLAAYVESTETDNPAKPMVKSINQNFAAGSFVASGGGSYTKEFIPTSTKALLGYNVYRNGSLYTYTTELTYLDEDLPTGTYSYYTTAVYDEGESGPSNIVTVTGGSGSLYPPTNLVANYVDNDVFLDWDAPSTGGGMVELYQHDGIENNGYYEAYDNGYGVVFDLDVYPGATLEAIDFRHSSWGITGIWSYKLRIVDWDSYTELAVLGPFLTTVNDNWELDVDLGSISGASGLVGIYLEPMSNDPEDAYPCIDWDVALDGSSFYGPLTDYSAMAPSGGDFLIDLWIMTTGDKQLVQPKKISVNKLLTAKAHNSYKAFEGSAITVNQKINSDYESKDLLGYNIYRNGTLIDYTTDTEYNDMDLSPGTYPYYVTAVYDEGESNPSNTESITIAGTTTDPPSNLAATINDCDIQLTWDPPGGSASEWIQWDNGTNTGNGIGLTSGGTFYVASRWTPDDLDPYDGMSITKMSFFPNGDASATYELMAWTGTSAGTLIMSQAVSSFNVDEFNEVDLTTPIQIDASEELWFGYELTHDGSTFPAGCDDGPAIQFSGDMITLDGSSWVSMGFEYGLDYNWNLAAFVESTDATAPAQPMVKTIHHKISTGEFVAKGSGNFSKKFIPSETKALLGYNIYRDGSLVDFTTETSFSDNGYPCTSYEYVVTAIYDEGESGPSNTASADVPCYPPENLMATVYESVNVHLESDPTVCGTPTGYYFYRDGSFIGMNSIPEYDDMDLPAGTYEYYSTALWAGTQSEPSNIETITISITTTDPPSNLEATIDDCDIQLTWDPPGGGASEWIQWDNGTNNGNGIGLTGGGTFSVASRWSIADLAPYDGMTITKISFFPNGDASATFVLKAWTGTNAGTQIMSQAVLSYNVDEFNQVDLTTPILIDASQELWFGYELTHGPDVFPAGCDDGPAIQYSGDMISLDGTSWVSMGFEYALYYNWNLAAYIESTDATAPSQPIVKTNYHNNSTGSFVAKGGGDFSKKFIPTESKALLGYNLYRDGTFLVFVTEETITISSEPCASYEFIVTAVYDEGESEPSNTVIAEIPCYPPENLVATVFEVVNVHLECDPPVCGIPFTYNFYRDGNLIGGNEIPEYDHMYLEPGTYEYYATVSWGEVESEPSNIQTVTIEAILYPPTNLTGPEYITFGNPIVLEWDAPSSGKEKVQGKESKEFQGYNIYRSYNYDPFELQGFITEESYSDVYYEFEGLYVYYVTAVYDEGESVSSNEHEVDILEGIEEHLFNTTQLFPNPATNHVNISSLYTIESINVYSFYGQIVYANTVNSTNYIVNTTDFEPGLYLFYIHTKEGRIAKRIVIQ